MRFSWPLSRLAKHRLSARPASRTTSAHCSPRSLFPDASRLFLILGPDLAVAASTITGPSGFAFPGMGVGGGVMAGVEVVVSSAQRPEGQPWSMLRSSSAMPTRSSWTRRIMRRCCSPIRLALAWPPGRACGSRFDRHSERAVYGARGCPERRCYRRWVRVERAVMDVSNAADGIGDADLRRHMEEACGRVTELLNRCASEGREQQISDMFALLLAEASIMAHVGGNRRRAGGSCSRAGGEADAGLQGRLRQGEHYQPGDMATFAGSMWFCTKATEERPGQGPANGWQLCVKRGIREGLRRMSTVDMFVIGAEIDGAIQRALRQDVELLRRHGQPSAAEVEAFREARRQLYVEHVERELARIEAELAKSRRIHLNNC